MSRQFAYPRVLVAFLAAAILTILATVPKQAVAAGTWRWPVSGEILTPFQNGDNPYAAGQHRGVDIAAPVGTAVAASVRGTVTYAGRLPDSGNCVTVLSFDGAYLVSYLHLATISVKRGGTIVAGATLGEVGLTGKRSVAAAHLHLGVRKKANGAYVDPMPLLGPRPVIQSPSAQSPAAQLPSAQSPSQTAVEDVMPLASAPPSTVQRPARRVGSRAHSRARSISRRQQRNSVHPLTDGRPITQNVHAQPQGDSAGAAPTAADGSARESHASRGRVAPPPLPRSTGVRARSLRSHAATTAARSVIVESAAATIKSADQQSPADSSGIGDWLLRVLLGLTCGAVALRFMRSQRRSRHGGYNDGSGGANVGGRDGDAGTNGGTNGGDADGNAIDRRSQVRIVRGSKTGEQGVPSRTNLRVVSR